MKIQMLVTLALTLLAVSACVVEPIGGRGYYGHGEGGGGHERGGEGGGEGGGGHDHGRGVWRD